MSIKKDIELCGIGNSLLDIQYIIPDETISRLNIKKGEMRLVDSSQQNEIINKLGINEEHRASGGSAANTIIAYSQFGGTAAYNSKLGDDDFGKFYAKEFRELGIILDYSNSKTEPTGTCLILITPDSERTMFTSLGASAFFGIDDLSEELIKRAKWIYIEGYKFSQQSSTDAVFKAIKKTKKYDTKVSLTFSDVFITDNFRDSVNHCVSDSDLIFCNEAEAINFTQSENINESIDKLKPLVEYFAITLGNKGAVVKWKDELISIPPYPATPVDSTGAGDIFAAGFFYGIIKYNDPVLAGKFGSLSGSKIVSQIGPRLKEKHSKIIDFFIS
ncbi:MAG: adenosine kinase [Ignavibacteriae bacterium]|nr:adenosine kinase [Ignavibacteriota bacterium]